jgi:hypothetical protein
MLTKKILQREHDCTRKQAVQLLKKGDSFTDIEAEITKIKNEYPLHGKDSKK